MSENEIKLSDLCNQVEEKMHEMGYKPDSINRYRKVWERLQRYSPTELFVEKVVADFLNEQCKIELNIPNIKFTKSQMYVLRSVRVLSEYNRFKTFFRRRCETPEISWPDCFKEPMQAFFVYADGYGYSASWLQRLKRELVSFIQYLDRMNITDFDSVTAGHISSYLETQVGYSQGEVAAKLTCLKILFKFLFLNGCTKINIALIMPKCRVFPKTKLPTVWPKEDIEKILNSVDRGNPTGKRDYAVLLIVARLGLRVSDICTLNLNELNWENRTTEIVQTKTKEPLTLPMSEEVGWAIIDYLKSGRPVTQSKNVFIRHLAPFEAFADHENLQHIIRKYIRAAGVKLPGKRAAMHSLRNSLATELLQQNVPLPTIAGILGHASMETSRHYLRVDLDGLRKCALDVEVFVNA